jgi:chemotaxis protein CheY-P-specific phosphatase CheC
MMIEHLSTSMSEIEEKMILLSIIGILEALKRDCLQIDEAEKFLFSPHMINILKSLKGNDKIINLLERGCELEDIVSLIPEKLEKIINELKESAIEVLKGYPKFVKTFWVD